MIVGPLISQAFFEKAAFDPQNPSLNGLKPTNTMFLVALAFFAVSIAPIIWLLLTKKAFAKKPAEDPLVK
jgi:hypothetical protein